MSSRSLSDIKTRAEGESFGISDKDRMLMFYRAYKTNHASYECIGEVILKIHK
jgi:hypothetical protein